MTELRRFLTVDIREAVLIDDLEKDHGLALGGEAQHLLRTSLKPVGREGADELTLRREENGMLRTFTDTANVGNSR